MAKRKAPTTPAATTAAATPVTADTEVGPKLYRLTAHSGPSAIFVGDFPKEEAKVKAAEVRLNGLSFGNPDGEWHCYPPHVITRLTIKPVS